MKVFLIILAVLVVIFALILSLSAEFTVVFDKGWSTKVKILFIEKDIELSKLLSFVLFPEKAAQQAAESVKHEQGSDNKEKAQKTEKELNENKTADAPQKQKSNPIKKIIDEDGFVGIMLLVSNLIETASSAVTTLIKGLHIYSLYVKMIIGGGDAAEIGQFYGTICGIYYPIKGFILNGMKVDQYDDFVQPDFIAPASEYEFQFIGSINVALLLKVVLKAAKVFLVNLIKNK